MSYKHGAYGRIGTTQVRQTATAATVPVYFGLAPINLIRGWATKGLVNKPIKLTDFPFAQRTIGYSSDWDMFTLCEAVDAHFANAIQPIGPIYVINVLDPATHKATATPASVTLVGGRGTILSKKIILDSITITGKTEGTHYTVDYDFVKGAAIITTIGTGLTSPVTVAYDEIDVTEFADTDIIGGVSGETYTGISAIRLLYQTHNVVPNLMLAPKWSETKTVHDALIAASAAISGHWDAFVLTDIPTSAADTRAEAITWIGTNNYLSEREKVCWPIGGKGTKRYHMSTLAAVRMMQTDAANDGVPYESPSNKPIDIDGLYVGSTAISYDQLQANELNEEGITTAVFWGGRWVLWGPHTAAFEDGEDVDARAIFDVNMRMLMHLTNGFQQRYGNEVDKPFTRARKDQILNSEREILDGLKARGAILSGDIEFVASDNPTSDMLEGDFVYTASVTPMPPAKSLTAVVSYSDAGFSTYFGGEA